MLHSGSLKDIQLSQKVCNKKTNLGQKLIEKKKSTKQAQLKVVTEMQKACCKRKQVNYTWHSTAALGHLNTQEW